ncbi:hypothetical protein ACFYZ4_32500 [Streptomyces sp. NPDC001513]|uniref:hypothetical protein n=1 Tax=Streptomyces sp. NPDC001513 TaxID=3364580 RepID=UPI0036D0F5FD
MSDQPDLFSAQKEDSADGLQHISPFVAPVAATAGAVTADPVALRIAEAIRGGDLDQGVYESRP